MRALATELCNASSVGRSVGWFGSMSTTSTTATTTGLVLLHSITEIKLIIHDTGEKPPLPPFWERLWQKSTRRACKYTMSSYTTKHWLKENWYTRPDMHRNSQPRATRSHKKHTAQHSSRSMVFRVWSRSYRTIDNRSATIYSIYT